MVYGKLEAPTRQELDGKIAAYLESYHPAGYGTIVSVPVEQADGTWTAHYSRGSSCD